MKKFIYSIGLQLILTVFISAQSYSAGELFRSNTSGNWNANSTWEMSTNGGANWAAASITPSSASGTITIRSPHIVTVNSNENADQLVISTGSQIVIGSGFELKITDATSQDIRLESGSAISGLGVVKTRGAGVDLVVTDGADFNAPLFVDSGITRAGDIASPFIAKFNNLITINAGNSLEPFGGQSIQANSNVINNGTLSQSTNSTFIMKGPSFINNGSINILTFRFDSATSISGSGIYTATSSMIIGNTGNVSLNSDVTFSPPSSFTINSGGILSLNNKVLTLTQGFFTLISGATVTGTGTFRTQGTPRLTIDTGSSFNANLNVNTGTTTASQSTFPFIPQFNGTITIDNGAEFTNTGGSSPQANNDVINNGTISPFNSSFRFAGSVLTNNNSITAPVSFLSGNHSLNGSGFTNSVSTILTGATVLLSGNHKISSVNINSGGTFSLTGFKLSVTASNPITNNGTFTTTNSTIEYNGTSIQNISFTNILYRNLRINNSSNVALTGNVNVSDTLSVVSGDVFLFGFNIILLPSGFLTETPGNTVQTGCCGGFITTSRVLNAPNALNVGGLGAVITTSQNLDTVEIRRGHIEYFGINGASSILRYFDITPKNNSDLNASLTFKYDDSELNNLNEGSLSLYRSTNSGSTFTFRGGTINTSANTITLSGIDAFSKWTVGRGALTNQVKLLVEGFYNTVTNKLNMRDTVRVYLRNTSSPFAIVDSAKAVIDSNTFIGNYLFLNAPTGNYYIQLKHRNSIETWSKSGGEAYTVGTAFLYDFTTDSAKAFGNNMVQKGSKFCVYSGDITQDGNVDGADLGLADNQAFNFVTGYINADVNGDRVVDAADMGIVDNNAFNFVSRERP